MLVRMNFGKMVGEVRDIEPEAARAMVADGRASLPNYEKPLAASVGELDSRKAKAKR